MLLLLFYLESIYLPTLRKVIRAWQMNYYTRPWFTQICVYRFYIPLLIRLANDLEVNPGPSYSVDCYKTVSADCHQGDVLVFGRNSGKQCVAMCLRAVIYNCKTNASTWSTANLNEILLLGNSLYSHLSRFTGKDYLLLSETPSALSVDNSTYFITLSDSITGDLYMPGVRDCYMSLQDALNMLMAEYRTFMLTLQINTVAIIIDNQGHYKLFDSHSRDSHGNVATTGKSILLEFNGIDEVVQYLQSFHTATSVVHFEILGVKVTCTHLPYDQNSMYKTTNDLSSSPNESPSNSTAPCFQGHKTCSPVSIRTLDSEQADTVRRSVNNILQQAEPPKHSITKEMQEALKNLKQDDSIMILPGDKGRASVVLNIDRYHDKMKTLIETGPYQLLNNDPTDRKLPEKLLSLKRSGHLSETVYNKIKPRHKQPPRIYGQPKIHNPEILLRPIVSCVNTFAYDLSAHLANILSPLTGISDYTVTNSSHFVSTISHERIQENEVMVSFDVESLFTNVPIEDAVKAALCKLENDPGLADRTNLTPTQIADLLNFVLRSTYFQYNGSIYEQKDGAAMGSPVSAVTANLYMEEFEERAIATETYKPKIWKRYVDDTFTVLGKDYVHGFLQHLNSQQPTIRFTMEIEKDNTIPFLDTSVSRDSNGLLTTTVYRKPTHTNQYLAYDSRHPQSVKRGIVECLYDRAKHLTSKPSAISEIKKHLSSVLVSNGYPSSFVRKLTKTARPTANKEPTSEFKSTAVLPYIKGESEVLRRC